jgi:hypothetical protein
LLCGGAAAAADIVATTAATAVPVADKQCYCNGRGSSGECHITALGIHTSSWSAMGHEQLLNKVYVLCFWNASF